MSVKEAAELKGLQVRLERASGVLIDAKSALADAQRKVQEAQKDVNSLEDQIKTFEQSDPVVTEHALLRYLERVMGIDLEIAKAEILNPSRAAIIKSMGSGKLDVPVGGYKIVFKNRAVVTIE